MSLDDFHVFESEIASRLKQPKTLHVAELFLLGVQPTKLQGLSSAQLTLALASY